ncbi:MAG: transcriptional regulator [Bacteroidetes bacterium]|nr:MAG: transcriptional regulator [Bacteroidota bacterium]
MRRDVFQAIADPTRRQIIRLTAHESLNLNAVAENFDMSRPAISKHIRILTECGLVIVRQEGRERFCRADLSTLHAVSEFIDPYRKFWSQKLDSLEAYLAKDAKRKRKRSSKKTNRK